MITVFVSNYPHVLTEFPKIPPMVCGIWAGESKPILNEFIKPLVCELKDIVASGIVLNSHHIKIKIGKFLGDTPARSLMKGIRVL